MACHAERQARMQSDLLGSNHPVLPEHKCLFGQPLRQALGMVQSLLQLAKLDWPVPDFSTVCRRQKTVQVELSDQRPKSALQLLVDSTGVKFLGEGECRRKRHGAEYRREYRSCWHRLRPMSASKASARMVPTTHEAAGTPSLSGKR